MLKINVSRLQTLTTWLIAAPLVGTLAFACAPKPSIAARGNDAAAQPAANDQDPLGASPQAFHASGVAHRAVRGLETQSRTISQPGNEFSSSAMRSDVRPGQFESTRYFRDVNFFRGSSPLPVIPRQPPRVSSSRLERLTNEARPASVILVQLSRYRFSRLVLSPA